MLNNPMNAVTTKFVRTSTNKVKCPVFVIRVSCCITSCQLSCLPCLICNAFIVKHFWTFEGGVDVWGTFYRVKLSSSRTLMYLWGDHSHCVEDAGLRSELVSVFPVCLQWTPEGRRLVTGASSGEFTLWNGLTFNFETILQVNIHPSVHLYQTWRNNDIK